MPFTEELILTFPGRRGHTMPYRATWGALSFGQEEKAGVKSGDQHLYWGWCGKGKAGQGKHFRISQRESFWQAFGFRGGL